MALLRSTVRSRYAPYPLKYFFISIIIFIHYIQIRNDFDRKFKILKTKTFFETVLIIGFNRKILYNF